MPTKKAFLVDFGFTVRVVADATASDDTIASLAVEKIIKSYMLEDGIAYVFTDNIGTIEEDTECPFGEFDTDFAES